MAPPAESADDYIFVRLPALKPAQMEVRYVVDGALFINEVLDLSAPFSPSKQPGSNRRGLSSDGDGNGKSTDRLPAGPRPVVAVELLALNLPQVRQLREMAKEPGRVAVEISFDGRKARTVSLPDLVAESASLRQTDQLTIIRSVLTGPGAERKRPDSKRRIVANEYLESCTQCTSEMPCDTECGWDPNKGAPNTCGEQGYCGTCPPERQLDDYWTVTAVETGTTSTAQQCIVLSGPIYRWFQEHYTIYRHDHVHYMMICYDSPNCVSCWPEERVVESWYETKTCWDNTNTSCNPNQVPYYHIDCDILCQYWGGCED